MAAPERSMVSGWIKDPPHPKDIDAEHGSIAPGFRARKLFLSGDPLPDSIDLRKWCSPIVDQGNSMTCTANATTGLVEYFEKKTADEVIPASRSFLYKKSMDQAGHSGSTGGVNLRYVMQAMKRFGVPPESDWDYTEPHFTEDPPQPIYDCARNYETIRYVRVARQDLEKDKTMRWIKSFLAAEIPFVFGFHMYPCYYQQAYLDRQGRIPFPTRDELQVGGHAVMAVGYDDGLVTTNTEAPEEKCTGALRIKNSVGTGFGEAGYGWLPYDYITKVRPSNGEQYNAHDWWAILKQDWTDHEAHD